MKDWPLALGMMWYSTAQYIEVKYIRTKWWILSRRVLCAAFERVYGRWLDDGDRVLRVINFRTALIEGRGRQRRAMMAIFWPFKG